MTAGPIWITGGRGFVGRHLAQLLDDRGHEVVILDRTQDGDAYPSLALDLSDAESVTGALNSSRPRAVVHLAAQSSGALSFREPGNTLRNNLDITLGLLEGMRGQDEGQRPRLLSVGSCEEYGAPASDDELPLGEAQPLRPANPYAVSKAAQTLLCQQYRRAHGLEIMCTRSFTHTGPGQRDCFAWSSFAKQIAALERVGGGELAVGNLEPSRDLSDVRDVARAYADLLEVEWKTDVVNVCSGREIVLGDALDLLRGLAHCDVTVRTDPARLRPHDVLRFVGDPSRLRELVGWVPSTPIERTLADLLDDWRERLS
jgi:GDP-4-dehydro-6-deoxy-D-mannose reductase